MKTSIKGKLDPGQISKNQEPRFYTFEQELEPSMYPNLLHFLNRDNRQTKKKKKITTLFKHVNKVKYFRNSNLIKVKGIK